jgi:hypothetical protein
MQHEFLTQLSEPVRAFVEEVEEKAQLKIQVLPSVKQNSGGSTGRGRLAVEVEAHRIHILAPTNGYFPDGGVRHEVLHAQRFHIHGVPKLTLAEEADWDQSFVDALGDLDNAIEHIVIVPVELHFHPERREHWETVMEKVCLGLPSVPNIERDLAVCMHWTFLRHVLPDSPQVKVLRAFATAEGSLEKANAFADQLLAAINCKEEMVRVLFQNFPYISKERAALEYISSTTGTRQKAIS